MVYRVCRDSQSQKLTLQQVIDGVHLTAQALGLSLDLDGLLHVTIASIKGLEFRSKHHCSHTGQRLSMATAVITAMRLKKCLPASTNFFQMPAQVVIPAMWRHGLFQCNDFFPFVVQQSVETVLFDLDIDLRFEGAATTSDCWTTKGKKSLHWKRLCLHMAGMTACGRRCGRRPPSERGLEYFRPIAFISWEPCALNSMKV
ncbi:TPA: hypothetical protein ACH3X1_011960 [Trebouxia sp. C0004]